MNEQPELIIYAKDGDVVCGTVLAWVDNGAVTVATCCVDEAYRGRGVGRALMLEIENRVKALGYHGRSCQLVLGFMSLSAPLFGQGSYGKSIISYGSKCLCQQSYFPAIQQCYVMYQLS